MPTKSKISIFFQFGLPTNREYTRSRNSVHYKRPIIFRCLSDGIKRQDISYSSYKHKEKNKKEQYLLESITEMKYNLEENNFKNLENL